MKKPVERNQRLNYEASDEDSDLEDKTLDPDFAPAQQSSDSEDLESSEGSKDEGLLSPSTSPSSNPHCDAQSLTVKASSNAKKGKRVWDKKHYCVYCEKPNGKMARHLERKHGGEIDVAKALSYSKGSKTRRHLLDELRHKGNYQHNIAAMKCGQGEVVTWRQPPTGSDVSDYLPCKYCLAFFVRKELWKHQAKCKSKKQTSKTRQRVQANASELIPIPNSASSGCQKIICSMQQDAVSFCIRNDDLICKFGDSLYAKHGHEKSQRGYMSQRMRELGRLLLEVRKIDPTVKTLKDLCKPGQFELAVEGAKKVAGYSEDSENFAKPATALKIGYSLKRAAEVLIGQSLMKGDKESEEDSKKFAEVMDFSWQTYISVRARTSLEQKRWNKDEAIPLSEDVVKLQNHLSKVEQDAKEQLEVSHSQATYRKLMECTLAQIIVFNRRRQGEVSKLLIETFDKRSKAPLNDDVLKSLTKLEQNLTKRLTRIEIRGKRGKKVPILLTKNIVASIELLIKNREMSKIDSANPYVFARCEPSLSHIRGYDCLKKYASECQAKNPERLRSTTLRKHVATMCQLMNLNAQELEQVAKFMGHDIRVHCEYYRLSENTLQLGKLSKLFIAMGQGPEHYKNRSLDELEFSNSSGQEEVSSTTPEPPTSAAGQEEVSSTTPEPPTSAGKKPTTRDRTNRKQAAAESNEIDEDEFDPEMEAVEPAKKNPPMVEVGKRVKSAKNKKGKKPTTRDRTNRKQAAAESNEIDEDEFDPEMEAVEPAKKRKKPVTRARTNRKQAAVDSHEFDKDEFDKDPEMEAVEPAKKRKKPVTRARTNRKQAAADSDEDPEIEAAKPLKKRKKLQRKQWTTEEQAAVHRHLTKFIALQRVPGKRECEKCREAEPHLNQRQWKDIKNYVYNTICSLKRAV